MLSYDRAEVQALAERLYFQARLTVIVGVVLGFVAGAALVASVVGAVNERVHIAEAVIGGGFGALAGAVWGRSRACLLGIHAQAALCQARIEENTRGASSAGYDAAYYEGGSPSARNG